MASDAKENAANELVTKGTSGKYNRHIAHKSKKADRAANERRIVLLDEIRGLAVFCMIFYHMFFAMYSFFDISAGKQLFDFFMPFQPIFAGIFIFISGMSSRLSHHNTLRGTKLLIIALALTIITTLILPNFPIGGMVIEDCEIYFGILHCLAICILIFSGIRAVLDKIPIMLGFLLFVGLFIFTFNIENGVLGIDGFLGVDIPEIFYSTDYFMPLGFHTANFQSADYFPLIPNLFLFLAGTYIGVYAEARAFPKFAYERRSALMAFLGRHALLIYILHMPIIYGVFTLITTL